MLPLTVYPLWLQKIAYWTPFSILLGERSALAIDFQWSSVGSLLLRLALWAVFVLLMLNFLYRMGLRKVNGEGG
jgi:ABC-type uncharacterized transport system permease subunit